MTQLGNVSFIDATKQQQQVALGGRMMNIHVHVFNILPSNPFLSAVCSV